jgi:hypothetical protein
MPRETDRSPEEQDNDMRREDEPIPAASEDKVLDETVRLAREGRKELDADPKEHKPASE